MGKISILVLVWVPILFLAQLGCSSSPAERLSTARAALAQGDFERAAAEAERGLAASSDERTIWALELVRLEANARRGDADRVRELLAGLEQRYAAHMQASRYVATAEQLRAAGQAAAAIEVLDRGRKRFPNDPALLERIESAKAGETSPEALEKLRSLGYIQ